MKAKYLSHAQAFAMCCDYQQLYGEPLAGGRTINVVAVVPYSRILQWPDVLELLQGAENQKLIATENPAWRYDVVLAAEAKETERGYISSDQRSYPAARKIPVKASRYACV